MTATTDRRSFLARGLIIGGCAAVCPLVLRPAGADEEEAPRVAFDETLGYCCARCSAEGGCAFLSKDPEVKRKKAEELTRRLGREIRAEDIHCSKCRVPDDVAYESIRGCSIRQCVIDRGLLSCAHCPELDLDSCPLKASGKERAREIRALLG